MTTVSDPKTVLLWMTIFLVAVALLAAVLFQPLQQAFVANEVFNGMILGVLAVGIVINFRQVGGLRPEAGWLRAYQRGDALFPPRAPTLLGPLATMLAARNGRNFRLSAISMRSLLDGIRLRLDESRDVAHYLVGLLIFLGLLGTFWGLLATVASASEVIAGLSVEGGDLGSVFNDIKDDLRGPLAGMGTAFSSSLFGLAGALVLGFLDLQAGHAQNRFFNDLEEWLSKSTHLSGGALAEGEQPLPAYIQALLEQTADSLDNLQRTVARSEDDKRLGHKQLLELTEKLSTLTDQLRAEQKVILGLARNQMELQPLIGRLAALSDQGWGLNEETREHIRNLNVCMGRLLEETVAGRGELIEQLRGELRLLARTVAASAPKESV